MDFNKVFTEIHEELNLIEDKGNVASYIPELSNVNPDRFGGNLTTVDGASFGFGDAKENFSIQSIAKVLSLTMAYQIENENLWKRVGVEPSGTPFNSLLQLEADGGIPRNPLINAGALVVCDVLVSHFDDPKANFIDFIRQISGNNKIGYCSRIAASEKPVGYRNAALINLMKALGNIKNDIDSVLNFYYSMCSIEMTCEELSKTFLFLANNGIDPKSGKEIINISKSKRLNAVMQLCGFYDEAGEFSFKVGLPGKSGVGGGIVAVHPGKFSIATWSPRLNKKGNSNKGMKFLELLTSKTASSIF